MLKTSPRILAALAMAAASAATASTDAIASMTSHAGGFFSAAAGPAPRWNRHRARKPWGGSVKRHARAMAKKARKA